MCSHRKMEIWAAFRTLKLNLKDHTPVQKSYNSIPKPLYKEMKECPKPTGERLDQQISIFIPGGLRVQEGQQPVVMCQLQGDESQDHP